MENYNFDNIRPYRDDEVNAILQKLASDQGFNAVIKKIYPSPAAESLTSNFKNIHNVFEFQSVYVSAFVSKILKKTVSEFSYSGLEKLNPRQKYLFISNHRDIILDSAFLNIILFEAQFPTTQIAIGNNLLIYPWISDLVRLNKSFIVLRNLGRKEMLEATKQLSAYIRKTVTNNESSVWIAQKEGRTKDGNDKTHSGLLKMFNYSGTKRFADNFRELHIVPISISYEFEPCDDSKTREMLIVRGGDKYEKTQADDLQSMAGGVMAQKGRVHFEFCEPIQFEELAEIENPGNNNEQFETLAKLIDSRIYEGYRLQKFNYIAADIRLRRSTFGNYYTSEEKDHFLNFMKEKLSTISGDQKLKEIVFTEIYGNPAINKLKNSVSKA